MGGALRAGAARPPVSCAQDMPPVHVVRCVGAAVPASATPASSRPTQTGIGNSARTHGSCVLSLGCNGGVVHVTQSWSSRPCKAPSGAAAPVYRPPQPSHRIVSILRGRQAQEIPTNVVA